MVHAEWKNSTEIHLSLLNCAYVDIKSSLLSNQHFEDVHSGNYDGGRGPSQLLRQKRKAERDMLRANEIGRDLVDYEVDMSITPTMVHVLAKEAGCEPPKKIITKSKLFSSRLDSCRKLKYTMKIGDIGKINEGHRLFKVSSSVNARSYYQVRICTQPSCSCPDFTKYGSKVFCKHILFVFVFGLDISDVDM